MDNQVSFFDPTQEREAKRKRQMAELLVTKGNQDFKNEQAGGMTVARSPLEFINQGAQKAVGEYQLQQADEQEAGIEKQRQKLMQEALAQYGQDPRAAAATLGQDPRNAEMAFKLMQGETEYDRQLTQDEKNYQRQTERYAQQDALQRDLANMRLSASAARSGGLVPELNPETGQFEMVQSTAPRKLSATEQKNFYEQKAKTDSVRNALGVLDQVGQITKEPRYSGFGAGAMAAANRFPVIGGLIDDTKAANTTTVDNLLKELAYSRLQSTFPGAISNAERESLEKLQALSSYSLPEQEKIIQEARKVLQRQSEISGQMQKGIVTGDVYNSDPIGPVGAGAQQPAVPQQSRDAIIQKLRSSGIADDRIQAYLAAQGL